MNSAHIQRFLRPALLLALTVGASGCVVEPVRQGPPRVVERPVVVERPAPVVVEHPRDFCYYHPRADGC